MTVEDALNQLREKREGWKEFTAAVEEDLARERIKRLASRRGEIELLVLTAYSEGASIADIKRSYNTKDYGTIRRILDANEALLEQIITEREQKTEAELQGEFEYDHLNNTVYLMEDGTTLGYHAIELDDGEWLLDGPGEWDGVVLNDDERPLAKAILDAINRG
jgi:hypothetical protein